MTSPSVPRRTVAHQLVSPSPVHEPTSPCASPDRACTGVGWTALTVHRIWALNRSLWLRALLFCCFSNVHLLANETVGRIVSQRPDSGRYVATDAGFMVSYVQRIPGSDVQFEMVPVPGGKLKKRSVDGGEIVIKIEPFWMGKYEVTFGEFEEYAEMNTIGRYRGDANRKLQEVEDVSIVDAVSAPSTVYEVSWRFEFIKEVRNPVVSMTQFSARQYTKWLALLTGARFRLPSEAEWEYACRAGSPDKYCFGNDTNRLQNFAVFGPRYEIDGPPSVGSKKPNAFGLHDMHGSVSEWVLDAGHVQGISRLKPGIYNALATVHRGSDRYSHVARGGHFFSDPNGCACSSRELSDETWWEESPEIPQSPAWLASDKMRTVGFRVLSPFRPEESSKFSAHWDPDSRQLQEAIDDANKNGRARIIRVTPDVLTDLDGKRKHNTLTRPWNWKGN